MQKGGVGRFGDNAVYLARNGDITNVHFVNGSTIRGVTINEKINHSDYMIARHMLIFSSYICEFGEASEARAPYEQEKVDRLLAMADWTNVSYYVQKRNITLNSPEMRPYAAQINALPR